MVYIPFKPSNYEVDIIGSFLPVRELGIREAVGLPGNLPVVTVPGFECRSPRVESFKFCFVLFFSDYNSSCQEVASLFLSLRSPHMTL